MNLQESIRRILREEGFIPLPIKRRVSPEDIEEAFDYALERMGGSMNNPDSIIYKEKGTTLKIFAKFVIDEMVTYIEQDYFNDNNRIYFSDNDEDYEIYHEKIRKPLLRHYGKRIKEKYDEVMFSNNGEMLQESIRRILREDSFINYLKRRISFDTIDKRFLNSLKYAIDVFKQRKALDYGSSHFKALVVTDLMDDIHPLLQRHYKKEGDVYDEIYDDLENFIYGKYDEVMDQVFHEKFKKEKNINESKKLLRRFPLDEMEHIFNEALETVSEQLINSIQQNDMMSYLDFRDVIMSSILKEVWNNHKELYKYYNENEFEFTYFIYKLYGDTIFKKYMDLSKVKRDGNLNESDNKKDYTKILKELVQPYYDYDGVCDIRVEYDKEEDMYGIYIVFSEEELNDIYKGELQYHLINMSYIRRGIYNDVDNYLSIYNVYVGTYQEPNCNTINNINES